MSARSIQARRPLLILSALVAAVALAACGNKQAHPTSGNPDGSAASGFYFDAGAITYQVQLSRELNPYSTEDKAYLQGVTEAPPTPSEEWFAVFLRGINQSAHPATTSGRFTITDTQGNVYYPVPIDSSTNLLAWTPQLLRPNQVEPMADTPASYDLAQGSELLFKISDSAYSNRPLRLNVYAPGQVQPSHVELDL